MKLVSLGTAGLLAALCGSTGAFARVAGNDFTTKPIPTASVSSSNASEAGNDSFLVVDKGEMGITADSQNPARSSSANSSVLKSVESSGTPADSSGVPVPRAGWISFFGLVGVI